MPVDLIGSAELTSAAPYSYASVVTGDALVLTAGACPLDADGVVAPVGDRSGQARLAVANLVEALSASGATLEDVAKTTVYVVAESRDQLVEVWRVVEAAFGAHRPPSTLLGVALLGYEDQLVEIEALAVRSSPAR